MNKLYLVITSIIVYIFTYFKGKYAGKEQKINEILKDNNDIQKEMDKVKVNDVQKAIDLTKKGLFILCLVFLTSCIKKEIISTRCPKPINYSIEMQKNIADAVTKVNNPYINQVFLDLFNINQQLRICN